MRSKASIKSHPVHPILVTFPIAFFVGTFVLDICQQFYDSDNFNDLSVIISIAGIGGALLAAIPGIIDYLYTVPPESSGKKRASQHGLLNITVVLLFGVALYLKMNHSSVLIILIIEAIAVILLSFAGWMGGTLVYRNQIGVDPRYANAGKWNEEYFEASSGSVQVASSGELEINQMKLLVFGKKRIFLSKTEKGFFAFHDRCTHRGGSLAGGALICGTVQCPWHGSQFRVETSNMDSGN